MDSSAIFASSDEWSSQSSFFSKLGNYFDRPKWWEEGAETLKAFFDGDAPHVDTTDQRLEDLLDLLEPLKVCEEPSSRSNTGVNLSGSAENTTDPSALQQEPKYDLRHDEDQSIGPSNDNIPIQAETVDLSTDSFSTINQAHVESAEKEVAPAITDGAQDSQSHSKDPAIVKPSSILDSNASDVINTSSPLFTGTTTSTRQTSPQPDLSARASSTIAGPAVSFDSTFDHETIAPSPPEAPETPEAPKLGLFVATPAYKNDSLPELTERNTNSALKDLAAPVENAIASTPNEHMINEHVAAREEVTAVSEDDPTGLQAVKDEISNEHDLPKAIDSSILTQEDDDDTVVHDPSAAAVSFFPPNPYSDIPFDSSFYVMQAPSTTPDGELGNDSHEHIDDSSADSTLTSLASGDGQLPESQSVDQVNGRERYTPSPPAFSPLTPPPDFVDTVNADVIEEVDEGKGGDSTPLEIASTLNQPITKLGNVKYEQHAGDDTLPLPNTKALYTANEAVGELADDNGIDGTQTSTDHLALVNVKRKQESPHSDEPAQKKRVSPITEDGYNPETKAKAVPVSEEETNKGRSRKSVQKDKNKTTPRSGQRNSPDELASASPDELADSSALNPFNLNRDSQKSGKPKLDRSTTSRSRVKKPVNAAAPLRRLVGVPKFTRGGVGRRELAELLGASPPRTAAEKEKVEVGGRLRSQSPTPAPDSAPDSIPTTHATFAAGTTETNETGTPAQQKRKRPTGSNPVSAQELTDLGNTPILENRIRARTVTVEPTPESTTQLTTKPAPKRTKSAISNAEVERLGIFEMTESRTRHSTAEPTPVPKPAPAPAKRAKKPVTKPVTQVGGKPSPFALTLKSKGTTRTSKKKEPPKKKAVGPKQDKDTSTEKQVKSPAKRKRGEEREEVGEGATRASKRIAGVEAEGQ